MLGQGSLTAWGVAPNKNSAQPELLGFGAGAAVFEQNPELRNNISIEGTHVSLKNLQDMLFALTIQQVFLLSLTPATHKHNEKGADLYRSDARGHPLPVHHGNGQCCRYAARFLYCWLCCFENVAAAQGL